MLVLPACAQGESWLYQWSSCIMFPILQSASLYRSILKQVSRFIPRPLRHIFKVKTSIVVNLATAWRAWTQCIFYLVWLPGKFYWQFFFGFVFLTWSSKQLKRILILILSSRKLFLLANASGTLCYLILLFLFLFLFFFFPLLSYRNSDIEVKCSFCFFFFFFILSLIQWSLLKWKDRICNTFTCTLFLVSATITEIAITIRCTTKIVQIIWTTISHTDVCWPITAVASPVKTHLPADLTIRYCGVSNSQPARCTCVTSVCRWTWSWHSCTGGPLKTKPTRSDSIVTIIAACRVRNLSVSTVKTSVILTFWYRKK